MSTNLHICARREITVNRTGKVETQEQFVDVWQTPTDVTYKIMAHDTVEARIEAYKAWVLSVSEDQTLNVYAEDDLFHEREPVARKTINMGREECEELDENLAQLREQGYDIFTEAW